MPYMIYQQVTTAVWQAYKGREDVAEQYAMASRYRQWLASLAIDPKLRDQLVEPVTYLEDAFLDLLKQSQEPTK